MIRFLHLLLALAIGAAPAAPSLAQEPQPRMNLLPTPKSLTRGTGSFVIDEQTRIFLPAETERPEYLAAERLRDACRLHAERTPRLDRLGRDPYHGSAIHLRVRQPAETHPLRSQAYRLDIRPDRIDLEGASNAGLYHGIQTLLQLVEQYGATLPALLIDDEPDFQHRGFYHDVSRGKVPTLETLKWLVDYLSIHKINMFQLYVEHPFEFRFDPAIGQDLDPLTPEEILELDAYCADRRIDFVPSLQSFGHMGGVLSLPQYRHLADVELEAGWKDLTWHQRMKGATINMSDPEALALLTRMHDAYLPLFRSGFVNVCADETYDLGRGKNTARAEEVGRYALYLQHIAWLNDLAKDRGRRMMFWGDIVKQDPESIPNIPKDTILLNWGYHRNTDYESTKLFADAGLDFMVCPGTSGWNRILNNLDNAEINIRTYAETGKKYGALGVLNTDWGDYGHYNLLGGSLHPIALGAAVSWNTEGPDSDEFDRIWNVRTFGIDDNAAVASLREQSAGQEYYSNWPLFFRLFGDQEILEHTDAELAQHFIDAGAKGEALFDEYARRATRNRWALREYRHQSRVNVLFGRKYFLARDLASEDRPADLPERLRQWADDLEALLPEYRELWLARNKESDLAKIEEALRALAADARQKAG